MHITDLAVCRAAHPHLSRIPPDRRWYFPAESFVDLSELHGLEFDPNDDCSDMDRFVLLALERVMSSRLH